MSALVAIGCGLPPTMRVGIVKGRRRDERPVAPGRRRGVDVHVVAAREVVGQPVRGAERQAPVANDVPREAEARREIQAPLVIAALAVGEAAVAGVDQPGRRVEEHLAPDVVREVVEVEVGGPAVQHLLTEEWFPANAQLSVTRSFIRHASCA